MIIVLPILFVIGIIFMNYSVKSKYSNYHDLDRCNTQSFKVSKIEKDRGVLFLNDSLILGTAYNNDRPVLMLYRFIEISDSIHLKKSSDTLELYRKGKRYWFKYFGKKCGEKDASWLEELLK